MEPEQIRRPVTARARLIASFGALAAACGAFAADVPISLADIARTGDLVCELNLSGPRATSVARNPDVMLVYDQVRAGSSAARVISSRKAGARTVKLYAGQTGLHLVEDVTGSVIVTTLLNCEAYDRSGGRCVRFAAVNTWHFDQSVHQDPDTAFRRLPATSYVGFCDAWHMNGPGREN
ncbi:MAG: hypothetical protein A3I01_05885 [Betaproteobacteria bacterium RIFCSPLOWO2_02_FULL_65_24]|nr:MAG: hypothetical protein A3I01_05885 [Betaproteobacteria bacterium RIFCSPLOWO2_02_FULL_65_24]